MTQRPSVRMWRCPSHGVTGTLSGDSLFLHEQSAHNSRTLCVSLYDEPVAQNDQQVVLPGDEGYEDAFDVCPESTCPLYGKAVMADHRHLRQGD